MRCHWWGSQLVDSSKQGEKRRGKTLQLLFFVVLDGGFEDEDETVDVAFCSWAREEGFVSGFEIEVK